MNKSKEVALCGVLAALAVAIMCFGGMIPFMTYVCPVICIAIDNLVYKLCGRTAAMTWYAAVCILVLLVCPDKEAAAIFVCFGFYPVIKKLIDNTRVKWLLKILYFNGIILILYWVLINLMGIGQLKEEFSSIGKFMTIIMFLLGNIVFIMIDIALERMNRKWK